MAVDSKIQLAVTVELSFPSLSSTSSAVSLTSELASGTGAKATSAAVMLWRACVVRISDPKKNHSNTNNVCLCMIWFLIAAKEKET